MPSSSAIDSLLDTIARLRAPDGCPWDREQTHGTLCDCLVEEVAELLEAIDRNDVPHMREELGDLLLHVVMHAQMAKERGDFSFDDVAREVNEKMIRRHPHVFGDSRADNPDTAAVLKQWDEIKAREKNNAAAFASKALFKDLPPALSALLRAREAWKTIRKKNLSPDVSIADADVISRRAGGLTEEGAGAELFAWVAACRDAGIDPESALRRHTSRVIESATRLASAGTAL
jgi:XTP/dITP diphosphohydrolase/tetrapyrrole methylase family protein/MazG family protein